MDKYPEYPDTVGKDATTDDGETWETVSARGIGAIPSKSEINGIPNLENQNDSK